MAWTGVSNAGEAERGRGCGHASVGRCRKIEAGWVWCQAQADWGVVVVGHLTLRRDRHAAHVHVQGSISLSCLLES